MRNSRKKHAHHVLLAKEGFIERRYANPPEPELRPPPPSDDDESSGKKMNKFATDSNAGLVASEKNKISIQGLGTNPHLTPYLHEQEQGQGQGLLELEKRPSTSTKRLRKQKQHQRASDDDGASSSSSDTDSGFVLYIVDTETLTVGTLLTGYPTPLKGVPPPGRQGGNIGGTGGGCGWIPGHLYGHSACVVTVKEEGHANRHRHMMYVFGGRNVSTGNSSGSGASSAMMQRQQQACESSNGLYCLDLSHAYDVSTADLPHKWTEVEVTGTLPAPRCDQVK
jgi:hypothetical protein